MDETTSASRVLVVDDDSATLESIAIALRPDGHVVRTAPNGAVGLERVLTFKPDVVVFDFWMPVSDGRELVQGIREVARVRVGLVAMSGTPEVEDWCARVGVSAFVRKPFEPDAMREAVGRALYDARRSSSMSLAAASPESSRTSSSRRRAERAVLVVGQGPEAEELRQRLRDSSTPTQVAVVSQVSDAALALTSISVDAVAVFGGDAIRDPALESLVAESLSRNVPIFFEGVPQSRYSGDSLVRGSGLPGAEGIARAIETTLVRA